MANMYDDLKSLIEDAEDDFRKFYDKGNKAAGTRVRKAMQDLKAKAQEIRNDVQAKKNEG
ncbi:MAG: histone H1 [Bacteroidota bacterium]